MRNECIYLFLFALNSSDGKCLNLEFWFIFPLMWPWKVNSDISFLLVKFGHIRYYLRGSFYLSIPWACFTGLSSTLKQDEGGKTKG